VRHNVCIMFWENLGVAVRDRRTALGMTQTEVSERGGPSVETLRAIENNRAGRLSPRMRRALERALEWEPGSVDAILAGDLATPLQAKSSEAEVTRSAREAEESIVTVMPWLDDAERGQAIELLVALREPIGSA